MTVEERMLRRRVIDSKGCWVWLGATLKGYGYIKNGEKVSRVHRVSYELYVGPIEEGLEVDHLCRNRACFNPEHLDLVSRNEHLRRQHLRAGHTIWEDAA